MTRRKPAPAKANKTALLEQRARGDHARRLHDDPLIREFFDLVKAAALRAFEQSDPNEKELREAAYFRLQALADLKICFTRTIADGDLAAAEMKLAEAADTKAPRQPKE